MIQQVLTNEQVSDLRVYAARKLVADILAKRDELAELLGLKRIDMTLHIHNCRENETQNIYQAAMVLTEAYEIARHYECSNAKFCRLPDDKLGRVTKIWNTDKGFEVTVFHE